MDKLQQEFESRFESSVIFNGTQTKIDRLNAAAEIIEKEHKPKKMSVSSEQKAFASVDRIKSCYRCEFEFSCLDAGRPCSRYSYVD